MSSPGVSYSASTPYSGPSRSPAWSSTGCDDVASAMSVPSFLGLAAGVRLGHRALDLADRDDGEEPEEQQEEHQEHADRADEHADVVTSRVVVGPRAREERAGERRRDDDEALEPH